MVCVLLHICLISYADSAPKTRARDGTLGRPGEGPPKHAGNALDLLGGAAAGGYLVSVAEQSRHDHAVTQALVPIVPGYARAGLPHTENDRATIFTFRHSAEPSSAAAEDGDLPEPSLLDEDEEMARSSDAIEMTEAVADSAAVADEEHSVAVDRAPAGGSLVMAEAGSDAESDTEVGRGRRSRRRLEDHSEDDGMLNCELPSNECCEDGDSHGDGDAADDGEGSVCTWSVLFDVLASLGRVGSTVISRKRYHEG